MEKIFVKGCEAVAEAAVRAGCRFFAGYPITPQNEVPEYLARKLPQVGGIFVQAESEIASISMVFGAAAGGTRSMTSSASTGVSLMSEGISALAGAHLPAVICNFQRSGPGISNIQPSQQDYNQATKAHGHGAFRMLVLAPSTLQEAADMTYRAFDLADKYLNPVYLLLDGFTGAMMEPIVFPDPKSDEWILENKASKAGWALFDGNLREERRRAMGGRNDQEPDNIASAEMYERWKGTEVEYEETLTDDAELIITAYGISARFAGAAVKKLREEGLKVGLIRPVKVYPFPEEAFDKLDYTRVRGILSVEMSIPANFAEDVKYAACRRAPVKTCLSSGGNILELDAILDAARELYGSR
ncbi:MAG: 3-methyl-2-oxobutanoate dehydrogenase subunit VorB [Clostridiales Family XIII bacterium]|nr:3-methyl-2-oxobutanoate dehydrogenase subunit VorB [Clostridiales Family XIII bacterium]